VFASFRGEFVLRRIKSWKREPDYRAAGTLDSVVSVSILMICFVDLFGWKVKGRRARRGRMKKVEPFYLPLSIS